MDEDLFIDGTLCNGSTSILDNEDGQFATFMEGTFDFLDKNEVVAVGPMRHTLVPQQLNPSPPTS